MGGARSVPAVVRVYVLGSLLARALPGPLTPFVARLLGPVTARTAPARARMIARHLARVDPRLAGRRSAVNGAFASAARYWIESLRLPHARAATITRGLRTEGYEDHVLTGLAAGRGVILALPHLGGWEWAGRWLADRGHRITVVVESLEPPELLAWFTRLRSALGMHVVPLDERAGAEVLAALGRNEIVCLLSDRDIGGRGVEVTFFGETTRLPAGPATLALRTGAPLLPTAVYFDGRGHRGVVRPPLDTARRDTSLRADVSRVTQDLARALEDLVRVAPEQWHLFQPNWPSDLTGTAP